MLNPNPHLALLALLLGTAQQADAHRYRTHRHHHGRRLFKPSPTFMSNEMAGPFRPFHNTYPSGGGGGGGIFTSAGPLVDVFQEVLGDIKKASRHFTDSVAATARTPPHEVVETSEAAVITADLPGCKKEDVDAQISEEGGSKTLTITAVRKKPVLAAAGNPEPSSSTDASERDESAANPSETTEAAAAAAASPSEPADAKEPSPEARPSPPPPSFTEESYKLSFSVGDGIDVSAIRGSLEDGVLTLVLPKLAPEPPAEPIEIPIDFATGSLNTNTNSNANGGGSGQGRLATEGTGSPADADTHISLS